MNPKVTFTKEAAKSAAYVFVLAGLFTTTIAQFQKTRVAFKIAVK